MRYFIRQAGLIFKKNGPRALIQKFIIYPLNIIYGLYCCLTIKRAIRDIKLEESVDFVFNRCRGLIKPFQVKSELLEFIREVERARPRIVVEIGTAIGGSLFLLCRAAAKDARIISIDLPGGKFGGGYPSWRGLLYRSFASMRQRVYLIRGDSHQEQTLDKLKKILKGEKISFLYIDADHTYEGVKKDFLKYSPLLNSPALIAFHDIAVNPPEPGCGVNKFWEEIKTGYRHEELIADKDQIGSGIGILFKE